MGTDLLVTLMSLSPVVGKARTAFYFLLCSAGTGICIVPERLNLSLVMLRSILCEMHFLSGFLDTFTSVSRKKAVTSQAKSEADEALHIKQEEKQKRKR